MKLKTVEIDGKTYAEVADGKPLFIADDGKDVAFDAVGTIANLSTLRGEAKGHREAKERAEAILKTFEGIADPAAAIKAMETVTSLDQKKLIDAGEVDRVRAEISKGYEAKLAESDKRSQTLEGQLYAEKIGGAFARSPLIVGDKATLAIPADMVQARFGSHFKIEDGQAVAYDHLGAKIYSRANPAVTAPFDEALGILVDGYAHKDTILKGTGADGSQHRGGNGGNGSKVISQADFDALSPKDRAAKMAEPGVTIAG